MILEVATALITLVGWELLGAVARLLPTLVGLAWVLVVTGLFIRSHYVRRTPTQRIGVGAVWNGIQPILGVAMLALVLGMAGMWLFLETLPSLTNLRVDTPTSAGPFPPLTFLEGAVLAPIVEEFAFRGRLLQAMRRRLPEAHSVALNAAIFAIAHFQLLGLPARLMGGFIYGTIRCRTGSLWNAILLHAAVNALLFTVGDRSLRAMLLPQASTSQVRAVGVALVAVAMGLTTVLWRWRGSTRTIAVSGT